MKAGYSFSQLNALCCLSCWVSARYFRQTAWSLTLCFYLGKECAGVRKRLRHTHSHKHLYTNTDTQTLIHSELGPDFLTCSRIIDEQTLNSFTYTRTHAHRCKLQVCIRMTEGGGGVIFTSASVILSIKAKRTAACHNSLRQGVTQLLRVHLPLTQQRGWKVTAVTKKQWGRKKQWRRKDRLRECVIIIYRLISNLKLFYQVGK